MDSLLETLKNLGAGRLAVMLLTFFALIIFFVFIAVRSSAPSMTLLYGELSVSDSTEMAAKLDISNIPYKLSDDGKQISVPAKSVGKARMLLAQEGLPHQGSVGYEIFDQKQSFGTTSFQQNINQLRALEGELARTIGTMDQIKTARVHLVLPQRELFSKETQPSTASIFITLRGSATLEQGQIQAIQHLVAASVPQLKPSGVAIIDQSGNLLAKGDTDNAASSASLNGDELRQKYELRVTRSIEDMIGRVVGYGKVRAHVTADINMNVVNKSTESYNPEGQVVRSTQTVNEQNSDTTSSGGSNSVTVENNLPGISGTSSGGNAGGVKNNRTEETTNYEISKTVESVMQENGQVQKISIAVLVDGRYEPDAKAEKPKDAKEDWQAPKKYTPRTQEELDKIASLVKSSVGFDESRGDKIDVVNMQFSENDVNDAAVVDDTKMFGFPKAQILGIAENIALSLVGLLIILLVVKPLLSHISTMSKNQARGGTTSQEETALLAGMGQAQAQLAPPMGGSSVAATESDSMIDMSSVEGKVKASTVQKVSDLVNNHPNETVSVIRQWMSQEG